MAEQPETLGLKVLVEGLHPCVDIVAVHGLGANPDWAWIRKVENGNEVIHVNWLADENMLPVKIPNARIMTFNYESKWLLGAPKHRRSLCAIQLLTALDNKRKEEKDTKYRPLIFIGHSFGGIVIEQSMVNANSQGGIFQYLAMSTVGVIFLGTPHRGTQAGKWGEFVARSGKALGFGSEDSILRDLREDSETLRDLLYEFTLWANRIQPKLVCFFEQHKTDYGKRLGVTWKELVVDEISACIDGYRKVPLPTDHLKINKYSGPDDSSYTQVYPVLAEITQHGGTVVQGRQHPQPVVVDDSKISKENSEHLAKLENSENFNYWEMMRMEKLKHLKKVECLQSLFLSNPQDDLAAMICVKGQRVDGTCEWLLAHYQYTTWLVKAGPRLLWLSGGPGIGKTMISTFLVEEIRCLAEQSSQMTFAYYFCENKDERRRTATAILRGLLLQLLRQRPILFEHILEDFNILRDSLFTNFHALWRIFVRIIQDPAAGEVCCLIDALDECEKESRQLLLDGFTKLFNSHQRKKIFTKFVVSSRRENDIEESLSSANLAIHNIQVDSGKVDHDLHKFINVKVDELAKMKRYMPAMKEKIRSALMEKAGGTFLYISLVLHDLKRTKISSQVTQKLSELPLDLNKVYDRILSQIDADCKQIATLVLSWVTVARRPLHVEELAMTLALCMGKREVNTMPTEDLLDDMRDGFRCCEPLVYLDNAINTINLVHQFAKDYLLGTYLQGKDDLFQYHITLKRTNLLIFRTCWQYLSLEGQNLHRAPLKKQLVKDHCFLQYANQEWQEHALAADLALATGYEFKNDLDKLPILREFWLFEAAEMGQRIVVQRLLENGADPESKNWDERTPLSTASVNSHEAVVEQLLNRDDVVADSQDQINRTPLSYATAQGNEAIVKFLLNRNDVVTDSRDRWNRTPLSYAAAQGHEEIVKLLLNRIDVVTDSRDRCNRTPLVYAAARGYEGIVKLLLNRGDVIADSRDVKNRTPLSYAAEEGYEGIVRLLLSQDDVIPDTRDVFDQTPLLYAAEKGHEGVVKLLLSRSHIIANSRDTWDRTPLIYAAKHGYTGIVKLLLNRRDVKADSRDDWNRSPLSYAAGQGYKAIVKLLLRRDDVKAGFRDKYGRSPLLYAARQGHTGTVKLLLSREDVKADSRDDNGRTPLSWAAKEGHKAVVALFLARSDVAVNAPDKYHQTALSEAFAEGHEAVVKMLEYALLDDKAEGESLEGRDIKGGSMEGGSVEEGSEDDGSEGEGSEEEGSEEEGSVKEGFEEEGNEGERQRSERERSERQGIEGEVTVNEGTVEEASVEEETICGGKKRKADFSPSSQRFARTRFS